MCQHYEEQELLDFMEENLSSNKQEQIQNHLKSCDPCQKKYNEVQELSGLLYSWFQNSFSSNGENDEQSILGAVKEQLNLDREDGDSRSDHSLIMGTSLAGATASAMSFSLVAILTIAGSLWISLQSIPASKQPHTRSEQQHVHTPERDPNPNQDQLHRYVWNQSPPSPHHRRDLSPKMVRP